FRIADSIVRLTALSNGKGPAHASGDWRRGPCTGRRPERADSRVFAVAKERAETVRAAHYNPLFLQTSTVIAGNQPSQILDGISHTVTQGTTAADQRREVAGRDPTQDASRPVLMEALGLAAQHVAIAFAASDDG